MFVQIDKERSGLDINQVYTHTEKAVSLLHYAVSANNFFLCKNNAIVDIRHSGADRSPLFIACEKRYIDIMKIQIEYGADAGAENGRKTLIHSVATTGDIGVMQILLKGKNMHIDMLDANGRSLLYEAMHNNNDELANFLLAKGANVNAFLGMQNSPLCLANDFDGDRLTTSSALQSELTASK